ncbi:MAG TPA: alpha-glucan family phosphorylase [Deinococcales bacterium]|nr:alpha-glucan family phosphorylase [Deinococcales bacterium]
MLGLDELARNYYWTWTPRVQALFEALNPAVYEASNRNPMATLLGAQQADLDRAAADRDYLERLDAELSAFRAYMARPDTYQARHQALGGTLAYFSMEFGFHESLQIYSGGLGVLAGDHCKSASDLGLPFVAVGVLFSRGSFHQLINADGWQEETYEVVNPRTLGLEPALGPDGKAARVWVELPGRNVSVHAWLLRVGRINVYLLDTNVEENRPEDRDLTARLYGGNQETRVAQELVLGVGGARMLEALGIHPTAYHMNEGHAAFLGLERARRIIDERGLAFNEAIEELAAGGIFTTHTPVPAGNDAFPFDLVDRMLGGYWYGALGLNRDDFLNLARHDQPWGPTYSMTVLALRCSRFANGVSELHGQVSRKMWGFLWPGATPNEVPITHVTNGVHTRTFLAPKLANVLDRHLKPGWDDTLEQPATWDGLEDVPDEVLWETRQALKRDLIGFVRERLRRQYIRHEAGAARVASAARVLSEDALTIGFARRFATYKRATLLFRDLERLVRIVNDADRPVQFIFAGKAHPADNPGKEFIQAIYRLSRDPRLEGKIVFLEDYDLNVARHLVQGCDIWLNNPRRPLEASGTSGEKAGLNGCLNFSVLDGWWREAFDGRNGWAIGEEREYRDLAAQDEADAFSLYDTLENQIIPLYAQTDAKGVRHAWLQRVRHAIRTVGPNFSMQRQVIDYVNLLYRPAMARSAEFAADPKLAAEVAGFKQRALGAWGDVRLEAHLVGRDDALVPGRPLNVVARVYSPGFTAADLRVECVLSRDGSEEIEACRPLEVVESGDGFIDYRGEMVIPEAGTFEVGVRVYPYQASLAYPLELALVRYA